MKNIEDEPGLDFVSTGRSGVWYRLPWRSIDSAYKLCGECPVIPSRPVMPNYVHNLMIRAGYGLNLRIVRFPP